MNFETTLLLLGGLLLGVGLLGKIEVKEAVLGTKSLPARFTCGLLGVGLIGLAVQDRLPLSWLGAEGGGEVEVDLEAAPEHGPAHVDAFFVVVSSTQSVEEAIRRAMRLEVKGYEVGVYESTTGFLAVAVRQATRSAAEHVRLELIASGLAAPDSYVSAGRGLTRKVTVRKAQRRPHNQADSPDGSAAGDRQ